MRLNDPPYRYIKHSLHFGLSKFKLTNVEGNKVMRCDGDCYGSAPFEVELEGGVVVVVEMLLIATLTQNILL